MTRACECAQEHVDVAERFARLGRYNTDFVEACATGCYPTDGLYRSSTSPQPWNKKRFEWAMDDLGR
jgi:hypothetical protein